MNSTPLTVEQVIETLAARLGPPTSRGTYSGHPTAQWGATRPFHRGVDVFYHASMKYVRMDVYRADGVGPLFVVAESIPPTARLSVPTPELDTPEALVELHVSPHQLSLERACAVAVHALVA